jgi:hypothetical protein
MRAQADKALGAGRNSEATASRDQARDQANGSDQIQAGDIPAG